MKQIDLGIEWAGFARDQIESLSSQAMNSGIYFANGDIEHSPYYTSSYKCPFCNDDRAVLWKLKLRDDVRTKAPKVFGDREIGLWNVFTCCHCGAWFASLNCIEGIYDLTETPGYQMFATGYTLEKQCLYSGPATSLAQWQRCFKNTLKIAKDGQ